MPGRLGPKKVVRPEVSARDIVSHRVPSLSILVDERPVPHRGELSWPLGSSISATPAASTITIASNETAAVTCLSPKALFWRRVAATQPGSPAAPGETKWYQASRCKERSMKETGPQAGTPPPPPTSSRCRLGCLRPPSPESRLPRMRSRFVWHESIMTTNGSLVGISSSPAWWSRARAGPGDNKRAFFASLCCRLPSRGPFRGAAPGRQKCSTTSRSFTSSRRRRLPQEGFGQSQ